MCKVWSPFSLWFLIYLNESSLILVRKENWENCANFLIFYYLSIKLLFINIIVLWSPTFNLGCNFWFSKFSVGIWWLVHDGHSWWLDHDLSINSKCICKLNQESFNYACFVLMSLCWRFLVFCVFINGTALRKCYLLFPSIICDVVLRVKIIQWSIIRHKIPSVFHHRIQ